MLEGMTPSGTENDSPELDLVPFFSTTGAMAEVEVVAIQGILDANGIPYATSGSSTLPVVEFVISVSRDRLADAQRALAEAQAAGPMAAEEAERASELAGEKPE